MNNKTVFDNLYSVKVGDKTLRDYLDLFPVVSTLLIIICYCLIIMYLLFTCGGGKESD